MKNCSFASVDQCHQLTLCQIRSLRTVQLEEKALLEIRSKVPMNDILTICNHHEQLLDVQFSKFVTKCSDPFKQHMKPRTKSLRIITLDFYSKTKSLAGKVVPGQKLCPACRVHASTTAQQYGQAATTVAPTTVVASFTESVSSQKEIEQDANNIITGPSRVLHTSSSTTINTVSDIAEAEPDISLHDANVALEILGETPIKTSK